MKLENLLILAQMDDTLLKRYRELTCQVKEGYISTDYAYWELFYEIEDNGILASIFIALRS